MSPSAPNILFTGSSIIERTIDFGQTWTRRDKVLLDRGNGIITLAISPTNKDFLMIATAPTKVARGNIFISKNGGLTSQKVKDLPDRIAKDFAFHPNNDQIIYAVFSGYGSPHLYKTTNNGETWNALENNLPDIPHHSLLVDPEFPNHLYIGNDLGVYFSEDSGGHFEPMTDGLPEAVYAINLSYSPSNRKIRLATHGNGVYEAPMVYSIAPISMGNERDFSLAIAPNPAQNTAVLSLFCQ